MTNLASTGSAGLARPRRPGRVPVDLPTADHPESENLARCPDCRAGVHQRTEIGVLARDLVTLRRYRCDCGVCEQPCRTQEVGVEPARRRWRALHRFHEGALLVAPFSGCQAEPTGRHAIAGDSVGNHGVAAGGAADGASPGLPNRSAASIPRGAVCAAARPARHRQAVADLGRDTDPTRAARDAGERAGEINTTTPAPQHPKRPGPVC